MGYAVAELGNNCVAGAGLLPVSELLADRARWRCPLVPGVGGIEVCSVLGEEGDGVGREEVRVGSVDVGAGSGGETLHEGAPRLVGGE